jgi:hypothetical protein
MTRSRHIAQSVLSASVGGAASAPIDLSVCVAPLRDVAHIDAAERRVASAPADPWDPWSPQRIGYDAADPFFPPQIILDGLTSYLNRGLR